VQYEYPELSHPARLQVSRIVALSTGPLVIEWRRLRWRPAALATLCPLDFKTPSKLIT